MLILPLADLRLSENLRAGSQHQPGAGGSRGADEFAAGDGVGFTIF